ncbi:MAG: VWA domain-containing protein [Thermoanaerobaculia bacterium]|nr:VWA domain-containing protein [Thermoanaerobaculia bacterium]
MSRPRIRPRFPSGLALLAAAGLVLQPPLSGQTGEGTYGSFLDRVEVEVVEVDVLVTDREGQPVRNLRREEFELLVDGRPVEIHYFAAPPATPAAVPEGAAPGSEPPGAPEEAVPVTEPATVVAYVDETAIRPGQRNQLLEAFGRVLAERLAAGDRVLVARFDEGLRLLTELTTDPGTVTAALASAAKRAPASMVSQMEEAALLQELESAQAGGGGGRSSAAEEMEALRLRAELESRASFEADRQRRATAALADLVGALGACRGARRFCSAAAASSPAPRPGSATSGSSASPTSTPAARCPATSSTTRPAACSTPSRGSCAPRRRPASPSSPWRPATPRAACRTPRSEAASRPRPRSPPVAPGSRRAAVSACSRRPPAGGA